MVKLKKKLQAEANGPNIVSTAKDDLYLPNPMWDTVKSWVEDRGELLAMAQRINDIGQEYRLDHVGVNDVDFLALMHDERMLALREQYKQFVQRTAKPPTLPSMPPPPHRDQLYGRVEVGESILDVGCGSDDVNVAKVQPYVEHLDYQGADLAASDANQQAAAVDVLPTDKLVTSFNAATQLNVAEQSQLQECDGAHIFPDVPELAKSGLAVPKGDGLYEIKTVKGVYNDRTFDVPGYAIRPGYLAANTFRQRRIEVKIQTGPFKTSYMFQPDATATDLSNSLDVGPKHDGVAYQLQVRGGKARLYSREGSYWEGTCDGPDLIMNLERVEVDGVALYILQRLLLYRGMVPYHCGPVMRYFASRVNVWINGLTDYAEVLGPLDFLKSKHVVYNTRGNSYKLPYDGVIYRESEVDKYVKFKWTFDTSSPGDIVDYLEQHGWTVRVNGDLEDTGEIFEWSMEVVETGKLLICKKKKRTDKCRQDTPQQVLTRLEFVV